MDAPATIATTPKKVVKINRWLPYWAVFQSDLHMTLRSWVYRLWLFISVMATGGYLLFHIALQQQAGMLQSLAHRQRPAVGEFHRRRSWSSS